MKILGKTTIRNAGVGTTVTSTATTNRVITLPDKNGIIATISDISSVRQWTESLTIVTTNVIPTLARIPLTPTGYEVKVVLTGIKNTNLGTSPDFSVSGATLTWIFANAKHNLDVGEVITVEYSA